MTPEEINDPQIKLKYTNNTSNDHVVPGMQEGKDYINISSYSDTELGKSLAPGAPYSFATAFGKPGNVRSAIDFIVTPNYPKTVMKKRQLTKKDIDSIPKQQLDTPNYTALLAYVISRRILADEKLQSLMKSNQAKYVSFNKVTGEDKVFDKDVTIATKNNAMYKYLMIVRNFDIMIKKNMFNREEADKFIEHLMVDKTIDLFDGTAITVL